MRRGLVRAVLCGVVVVSSVAVAQSPAVALGCADPSGAGLQFMINHTASGGTLCLDSGTYTPTRFLHFTVPITVVGTGDTTPVIDCTGLTFCFDGSAGPDGVTLQNLVLQNATKSDVQIGSGAVDATLVSGWTLDTITVTGAGQAGIAINNAADITVTNATVTANGSAPYDPVANPTGDFGLRANGVDGITVENSTFTDNPIVTGNALNTAYSGGAKFDTVQDATVQGNTFRGNSGGAQLWFDISSMDFHALGNIVDAAANAVTGNPTIEGIRAEVSCAGTNGSTIESNDVTVGTVAGIDLYDSSGIAVSANHIMVPDTTQQNFAIRMVGNHHGDQPIDLCTDDGLYPNRDNVASGNDIDMSQSGKVRTGIIASVDGITENDVFVGNHYTVRHCTNTQWFFAKPKDLPIDFATWQSLGEDIDETATCAPVTPDIDNTVPFTPTWGPAGTVVAINGTALQNVTTVKFNGKTGTILSTSPTQVTATVPSGNVTGPVCVIAGTDQRCTTAVFTLALIVAVTGESPSAGRAGDPVAITGGPFTGATGVTFGGTATTTFAASDTEVDATVPAGALPGPVCVLMPIQGTVCGPDPFSITPPDAPVIVPFATRFQLAPFSASWGSAAGAESYDLTWDSAPFNGDFGPGQPPITTTDMSYPLPFSLGTTTCANAMAVNGGGAAPSVTPACTAVPVDDATLTHGTGWTTLTGTSYFQGSAATSRAKGATLSLTGVQAKRLSLLLEVRPGGGTVNVLINGKVVRQIPTAGKSVADQKLVLIGSWAKLRTMTVAVRVVSTNKPVVIDGLAVSRV